jgi:hypothetical protein
MSLYGRELAMEIRERLPDAGMNFWKTMSCAIFLNGMGMEEL